MFSCLHFLSVKAALLTVSTVSLGQALEEAQARLAMRLSRTNKVSRCPLLLPTPVRLVRQTDGRKRARVTVVRKPVTSEASDHDAEASLVE